MPVDGFRRTVLATILAGSLFLVGAAAAQDSKTDSDNKSPANSSLNSQDRKGQNGANDAQKQEDPLKRPISAKQRKRNEKALHQELSKTYKKWLDEDVRWIITDQEREAFLKLSNDEERDQFIEQFWQRRNPTPDSVDNPYKDEIYRRIAYANEHFAAGIPGWKTDR